MNYKLIAHGGGGIFSILMDLVVTHAFNLNDVENIYIEVENNDYGNPAKGFDFVLDQYCDESFKTLHCGFIGGWRKKGISWGAIEDFEHLIKVKNFCRKLKIKQSILDKVSNSDLGIHFRGADMDKKHPKFGVFGYTDYIRKCTGILATNEVNSIFIASDNNETAERIVNLYDLKIPTFYFTNFIRAEKEIEDTEQIQIQNGNSERFWQEAFIDMLNLSRCKYLLCRTSNFSNAAIAFSDSLTKIYRL